MLNAALTVGLPHKLGAFDFWKCFALIKLQNWLFGGLVFPVCILERTTKQKRARCTQKAIANDKLEWKWLNSCTQYTHLQVQNTRIPARQLFLFVHIYNCLSAARKLKFRTVQEAASTLVPKTGAEPGCWSRKIDWDLTPGAHPQNPCFWAFLMILSEGKGGTTWAPWISEFRPGKLTPNIIFEHFWLNF